MNVSAVVFDLFGTLVDSYSVQKHEQVVTDMAAILGVPRDHFARLWGAETYHDRMTGRFPTIEANLEHICQALGVPVGSRQVAAAAQLRISARRGDLVPRLGAIKLLARLRDEGYRLGLVSNCSMEIPSLWIETPFAPLVDATIFSCSVGLAKPDPRIYRLACERLSARPEDCLYVGDGSSRELTGALRVGMQPVLLRIPLDDAYDDHRPDVDEWQGPAISALDGVLALLSDSPLRRRWRTDG